MGFEPRQVDQWTYAEFLAMEEGWAKAHDTGQEPEPPSVEELHEFREKVATVSTAIH